MLLYFYLFSQKEYTKSALRNYTKKELSDVTLDERLSIYKLIYMHKEDTEPEDEIA